MGTQRPVQRAILAVDVEGFNRPERSNPSRTELRERLFSILAAALERASAGPRQYVLGDTGDGAYMLVDPDVSQAVLLESFVPELHVGLKDYNRDRRDTAMMRLRVVLHTGYVTKDAHGWSGSDLNFAFRLLDSGPLREELRATSSPMALMVSEAIYQGVVHHGWGAIEPSEYRPVEFQAKETRGRAWLRSVAPAARTAEARVPPRQDRRASRERSGDDRTPQSRVEAVEQDDGSSGVHFGSDSRITIGGNVIGRDQINHGPA